MKTGNYRIWIGADSIGNCLVGAKACDLAVVTEHVYPSQMAHRVVVLNSNGRPLIMTPTEARERGLGVCGRFPRADGSKVGRKP